MKKFGIQKKERIKLQKEISTVFNQGRQYSDKYLKIFLLPNNKSCTRFLPVINKKFGNAVLRNNARRHLKELFRLNKEKVKPGYDIIFFIKNEFKSTSFKDKNIYYLTLLKRTGLIKE